MMGQERWPNLQLFLSEEIPDALLGNVKELPGKIRTKFSELEATVQTDIARECWDFLTYFKNRYDDWGFLRDGFGILDKPPADNRGKGHTALSRMKLLYDILAEAIRTEHPEWKPTS
jgi:hypothetical protein